MRLLLFLLIGCAAGSASAQTQGQMTATACEGYQKADDELSAMYGAVMAAYAEDTVFTARLREAQRAWLTFRDAHMASRYPHADSHPTAYGSVYPMCRCDELEALTEERTGQLRRWLDYEEGDVCAGSARPLN